MIEINIENQNQVDCLDNISTENCFKKWDPLLEKHMVCLPNEYFRKLICLCLEIMHTVMNNNPGDFIIELKNEISENPFLLNGYRTYNITLGIEDALLENEKLFSYYKFEPEGGIEIFRHYIDCVPIILKLFPEYIVEIREEEVDNLLEEHGEN